MTNQAPQEQIVNHMKNMIDENVELSNTPQDKTWRERFYDRYKTSDIYHEMYADWFPDDVMNFIAWVLKEEREKQHTALLDRVEEGMSKIGELYDYTEREYLNEKVEDLLSTLRQHPLL